MVSHIPEGGSASIQLDAICTRIALRLNSERRSPLYHRISSEQSTSKDIAISVTLSQIVDALKASALVGTVDRHSKKLLPGPFYEKDPKSTVVRSVDLLIAYFKLFSEGAKKHWELGNKANTSRAIGGHLNSSRGVGALILLCSSFIDFIRDKFEEDFRKLPIDDFVSNVEAYAQPLIDYFRNPSFENIRTFKRVTSGSGAAAAGMRQMQKIIRHQDSSFRPAGLEQYLEDERLALVTSTTNLTTEILGGLTEIIVKFLKQKYNDDWFLKGCPLPVKHKVLATHDKDPTLELEECFDMPTHFKVIAQSYGTEIQGLLRVPDLKWLDNLIEIRNALMHQRPISSESIDYLQDEVMPIIISGKTNLSL